MGVVGCMAQRLGSALLEHEAVDIVCGPAEIPKIAELVKQTLEGNKQPIAITGEIRNRRSEQKDVALDEFESAYCVGDRQLPGQAFVRVMRGCNNFCAYCIVPFVRGPEVSRPAAKIIEQIKRLAGEGVKQVTLLGQRVNSYRYTAGEKTYCLADLLYMASEIDGIKWVKFVTSYPQWEFYDEILGALADLPKVCNYLHMPAQSGSNKILRAMNRHYTSDEYLELLEKARAIVPGIAIAGDFMVGFPEETEEDFEATVELVKKAQYKNCFVFKYSPRSGTKAEKKLEDNIPVEIKKQRNTKLLDIQSRISDELSREFLGRTVDVLVEGLSKKPHLNPVEGRNLPQLVSRTATDWIVVFNGPESLTGQFVKVKITKTAPLTLFGQPA